MFSNVGSKIKAFAKVVCWGGIIASVIGGICCLGIAPSAQYSMRTTLIVTGIAVLVFGPLFSWLGSLFTYGFGELIEQATAINENLRRNGAGFPSTPSDVAAPHPSHADARRQEQLRRMLDHGLITEDEYNEAMGK